MKSSTIEKTPSLLLSMRNIHVSYNLVKALNGVDFDLYSGEIHALVGEHRAGKSSLVKLLSGAERRDRGEIIIQGKSYGHLNPGSAMKLGIGIVYQNLMVIPDLNAVENIFSPKMIIKPYGLLNQQAMIRIASSLLRRIGCSFDCRVPLYNLSVANQLMVEFARALLIEPSILILDEISNKLTPQEMKNIYRIMFELKARGNSIIYISHNMDEIQKIADRVTIFKNGYRRETEEVRNLSKLRLFQMTYSFSANQEKIEFHEERFAVIKRYLETIIQDFPVGILLIDQNRRIQLMNYEAIDIIGRTIGQFDGMSVDELSFLESDMKKSLIKAIDNRKTWSEDDVLTDSGKTISLKTFPLQDEDQLFIGTTLIIQDDSMNRCIDEYLIQTEKMASVAEVAVGVAHEINNPLCIIQNYIELIKSRSGDEDTILKIGKIEKELERIVSIISSLLSFSRIKTLPANIISISEVINDVLLLLNHSLHEKRIQLKWKMPKIQYLIQGNENKLKQVFMNLIINSIEAVLDNGKVSVKIENSRDRDFVDVEIQDTGAGIPEDVANNIFNPFFTTKISRKNSGLGLSISRHIIEEHNGIISFSSIPGESTMFKVRLPRIHNEEAARA